MFRWNSNMVSFMKDASEHTTYHDDLVSKFSSFLPKNGNVCDAGCGLGYLSLALAKRCRHVTAVDVSGQSLNVLRENVSRLNQRNIDILEGDIGSLIPQTPYDAMVFCFFGGTRQILTLAKSQCRGKVIIISKNYENHRFTLSQQPIARFTFMETLKKLCDLDIPHVSDSFSIEMGQPFRSLDDAVEFFRLYSKDPQPEAIRIDDISDKLIRQTDCEFPYYLPHRKQVGMIVLDTADIPANINTL